MTVDWMKQIGAATRSVRSTERDGKAAEVIAVTRTATERAMSRRWPAEREAGRS